MINVVFEFKEVYGFFIEQKLNYVPRKGEIVYLSDELLQNNIEGSLEVIKVEHIIVGDLDKNYITILLTKI